jgi:2-keto-4-pentenoate hydratase/2-oxohepta-3-ene-1,7-dioic acid hydratase in catechol pathway
VRLYGFADGRLGAGVGHEHLVDITGVVGEEVAQHARMTSLIARWGELAGAVAERAAGGERLPLEGVVLGPPLPRPGKVIAAPVNYRTHQREMGGEGGVYEGAKISDIRTYAGFIKASTSITGPGGVVELPFAARRVDHEAELGVVIGRTAARVKSADALAHVFGYVPLLDITLRGPEDRSYRKSFDTFTPIGPAIVTADEVPDPGSLELELTVNGAVRQRAGTGDLIYDVPRLVELYSEAMTLEPGDIIATGTPDGVGPLAPGDDVRLAISGLGELRVTVGRR